MSLQRKINKFGLVKKPVYKEIPYVFADEFPDPTPAPVTMTGFPGRPHGKSFLSGRRARVIIDDGFTLEDRNPPLKADKGKVDGSCNRTACQAPLAEELEHQFMDGNFAGGPRLHYCEKCAADFDKWDHQSGDRVRIKREWKEGVV